ncbi:hypothetical protein AX15_002585 [Amanita polypyramis BW_CC]|nr:hypothetical protein AX15_002585 [Amanita polypyramis BW_CC]
MAINVCVLGVGLAGLTFHVPFVLALPHLFTLHSVLERNPASPGGKVHVRFGVAVKIHHTFDQVLQDPDVELVIVATPNHTHYDFAKAALNAGKHVLVDKPVTTTVAQAQGLGDLAREKGLVLYAHHNRRWDSDFLALKRLLALPPSSPHSLGTLTEFISHFDRYRPTLKGTWKDDILPGTGHTFDLGPHLVDQALFLFGRPQRLTAFIQNMRGIGNPEVDDSFTIFLHYDRTDVRLYPLAVILRAHSLSVRSPQLRYVVRGTNGTFVKYGLDVQEDQLKDIPTPSAVLSHPFGREPESIWGTLELVSAEEPGVKKTTWSSVNSGSYIELFKNLGAVIRDGAEPAVKWEEATAVVELIELAHRSAREGVTVDATKLSPVMSPIELRVELPAYSRSFSVRIPSNGTILNVKEEIFHTCPGNPRVESQRLVWRGRYLTNDERINDLWKSLDEPRIVHLAVHPSGWSSAPPSAMASSASSSASSRASGPPSTMPLSVPPLVYPQFPQNIRTVFDRLNGLQPASSMDYIQWKHDSGICALLYGWTVPWRSTSDIQRSRSLAVSSVQSRGYQWPPVLDEEFPAPTAGGLKYEQKTIDGLPYLSLLDSTTTPTPFQLHAIKVLSYTFSLLSLSVAPAPTSGATPPSSVPADAALDVNLLLQRLGLPPLQLQHPQPANNNHNHPNNAMRELREIPVRPLLIPLVFLVFRTCLLLYFVAPAREPVFGILIVAWMLYEFLLPIRNALRRNVQRPIAFEDQGRQNNVGGNNDAANIPGGRQGQGPEHQAAPAAQPANAPLPRMGGTNGGTLFDTLASINLEAEQQTLSMTPGPRIGEPSVWHKIVTFVTLLVTTTHPAIWNIRRAALRRREGQLRTEANVRNRPDEDADREGEIGRREARDNARVQYGQRPEWVRRYIERVLATDWLDDAD